MRRDNPLVMFSAFTGIKIGTITPYFRKVLKDYNNPNGL